MLRERVRPARSRDAGNSMLSKGFPGGTLVLIGANSATETPIEHYGELIAGSNPFANISSSLFEVSDGEINQLVRGLFGWERAPRFDRFSDHPVQTFYGIGRINDLADRRIEGKERDHLLPCPPLATSWRTTQCNAGSGSDSSITASLVREASFLHKAEKSYLFKDLKSEMANLFAE